MRKHHVGLGILAIFLGIFLFNTNVHALNQETELLLKLLEQKGVITKTEANSFAQAVEAAKEKEPEEEEQKEDSKVGTDEPHYHSVKGLSDRVRRVEDELKKERLLGKWTDKIQLSGLVEVEASYEDMDFDDPAVDDEDSSDIVLATAELDVDVEVVKHVGAHIAFLFEEDETEPVDVDEAFIIIDGEDVVPFYLNAGKQYVPFGYFESHFISDP